MCKRVVLFVVFIVFSFLTIAQNSVLDKRISIKVYNKPLAKVLEQISEQTGLYFSYNPSVVNDTQIVSFVANNKIVRDLLDIFCSEFGYTYTIIDKNIILRARRVEKSEDASILTINGFVIDSITAEVIIGAAIYLDKKLVAFSNEYGFFSFRSTLGKHLLEVSYIGYTRFVRHVDFYKEKKINVLLKQNTQNLDVVVVAVDDNLSMVTRNVLDFISIPKSIINRNPALGGTYDALRSLQAIPGFSFYGDGSMIFHVRGGLPSQNFIIIDDAPLYNPVHLLGFFSAVSPWAVNTINVYKNDLPEKYPGRISSVIDIRIKQGDFYKTNVNGEISPVLTAVSVDGPISRNKKSFFISARLSNINWFYENKQTFLNIGFVDVLSKFTSRINDKNKLFISFFYSHDKVDMSRNLLASKVWWRNLATTLRWNHVFSSRLFLNTTFFSGQYAYFMNFLPDTLHLFNSSITTTGIKQDYSYKLDNNNLFNFGLGVYYYYFNPANINNLAYIPTQNAMYYYVYFGDDLILWDKLKIHLGLIAQRWDNLGPTIVYYYSDIHNFIDADTLGVEVFNTYYALDPRMSITFEISKKSLIKFAYGRNSQFLHLLSNSISPFTTVEAWFPANNNILPQYAKQISLGYFRRGINNFSLEFYVKNIENISYFADYATLLFNPYIESNLRLGQNFATGLEVSLNKKRGNFNYWLAYTYSRVFMRIPEIFGDKWLYTKYDKPHNFLLSISYKKNRYTLGTNWIYTSGNRYTAPIGYYLSLDHYVPIYLYPNNEKLPDYHRLDFYLTFRLNKNINNRFSHFLTFSLFNVYGRKNPVMVNFNKIYGGDNFFYVPGNFILEYELTPAYYYFLRFIPSLSYRFKF